MDDYLSLLEKIGSRTAHLGVIGLGYVGLPLSIEYCKAGFPVTGFDIDHKKVESLEKGHPYISHIDISSLASKECHFTPTSDFSGLARMDCIIICVPTPLTKNLDPDMSYIFSATKTIAHFLRKGQLIVLESTTYPGTTDEDMRGILEKTGLRAGEDFFLAFSPEREDPNNPQFRTANIPKVVGGYTEKCLAVAKALYDTVFTKTVPVSSTRVAEASKLLENIYRAVNIALVNELKMLFDRMGIDVWEVIETAKTKPFGFQAFYPGPGLGGHCIPIDPYYLTWKAREYDFSTRFIELAGEINTNMPYYIMEKVSSVLNELGKPLKGTKILILGIAYKKDVDDMRESPALRVTELLLEQGAHVEYHDPYLPFGRDYRHHPNIDMESIQLTEAALKEADLVLLLTDHSNFDYPFIERHAGCIIDTRNAFERNGIKSPKIHKA